MAGGYVVCSTCNGMGKVSWTPGRLEICLSCHGRGGSYQDGTGPPPPPRRDRPCCTGNAFHCRSRGHHIVHSYLVYAGSVVGNSHNCSYDYLYDPLFDVFQAPVWRIHGNRNDCQYRLRTVAHHVEDLCLSSRGRGARADRVLRPHKITRR